MVSIYNDPPHLPGCGCEKCIANQRTHEMVGKLVAPRMCPSCAALRARVEVLEKVAKCAEIFADSHNYHEQWRHDDALYALRVALRAALDALKEG